MLKQPKLFVAGSMPQAAVSRPLCEFLSALPEPPSVGCTIMMDLTHHKLDEICRIVEEVGRRLDDGRRQGVRHVRTAAPLRCTANHPHRHSEAAAQERVST